MYVRNVPCFYLVYLSLDDVFIFEIFSLNIRIMKKCPRCSETKNDSDFNKNAYYCKICTRKASKASRDKNRDYYVEYSSKKYYENHEANKAIGRVRAKLKSEERKEYSRKYYEENKEHVKHNSRRKYGETREMQSIRKRKYYEENKENILKRNQEYKSRRLKEDPQFALKHRMRRRLLSAFNSYSINGKNSTSSEYGINFAEIFNHVGPRPTKQHQLDHIIPLKLFNFDIPEQVKLANSPVNLRWITKEENLRKGGAIIQLVYETPELMDILRKIS